MIISKTPVRVSFFGGGTDYPEYFHEHGGCVLSTTIDKYIYVTAKAISGISDHKYILSYSRLEHCNTLEEIQHPVIREALKHVGFYDSIEIHIISDLPARTGIGSSSSFTVGLLHALYTLIGKTVTKEQLAHEAIYIEQVMLNERVGVQDQLAAAYGGFNHMVFSREKLDVRPVTMSDSRKKMLEQNLMMFYTGVSRYASEILEEQVQKTKEKKISNELQLISEMVAEGLQIVTDESRNLDEFGLLLDKGWQLKRSLSSAISNSFLDSIYDRAMQAGALGGKLLGAGGGGFFVFYVPDQIRDKVRRALHDLSEVQMGFDVEGSTVILGNIHKEV